MNSIQVLNKEHQDIVRLTQLMRTMAERAVAQEPIDAGDFRRVIAFIREYSDAHHHGKEEEVLFDAMLQYGGDAAAKLVRTGMLIEHDLARLYVSGMEESVARLEQEGDSVAVRTELVGHTMEYVNLLLRHAQKEDDVVYPFAQRILTQEQMQEVEEASARFEEKHAARREEQLVALQELCERYGVV